MATRNDGRAPSIEPSMSRCRVFGISHLAERKMRLIQQTSGLPRLIEFIQLLNSLSKHDNYKLLSSQRLKNFDDKDSFDKIASVIKSISENYTQPMRLSEVATKYGMSNSMFSRYFIKKTGNSFTDFVNQLRVHRACQLLRESDILIKQIGHNVGYNSTANFNRRFLELKGISPKHYRLQSKRPCDSV